MSTRTLLRLFFLILNTLILVFLIRYKLIDNFDIQERISKTIPRIAPTASENSPIQTTSEQSPTSTFESIPPEELTHGYQNGPIIKSKNVSYFIDGRTRGDLCEEILEWQENEGQEETLAYINYQIFYESYIIQNSQGFTIGDFTVTADSTITLPQWRNSEGASDSTKADWNAFKHAVTSHEKEHEQILIEYAKKLVNEFNNLPYYQTKPQVKSALSSKFNKIYDEMSNEQEAFDEEHGRSESFSHLCR